ncbi:unnamed protein product [Pleuronectes platessa]|uniref:Calx-beta domain-containing protein n=1 Tax=Pleuronectes platessa TaxID=8262 RepID=A0A9N7Z7H4_PLEPL|nr:unnamed protein product [Pleuronectes platessa]
MTGELQLLTHHRPSLLGQDVGIIDDDIFEEDEHFFVRLLNLRVGDAEGMFESDEVGAAPKARLVEPLVATVTILDDDHAGIFTFSERMVRVSESVGTMEVTVARNSGARGTVILPYRSESGSAKSGEDYEDVRGELEFNNDQTTQTFQVRIIDDEEYEKHENFFIVLEEPRWLKRGISASNRVTVKHPPPPRLSYHIIIIITLRETQINHRQLLVALCSTKCDELKLVVIQMKCDRVDLQEVTRSSQGHITISDMNENDRKWTHGTERKFNQQKQRSVPSHPGESFRRCSDLESASEHPSIIYPASPLELEPIPADTGREGGVHICIRMRPQASRPPLNGLTEGVEGQMSAEEEEARKIAEMGKPILGEHSRLEVVIEESYEFKSTVDKLIKKTNLALVIGTHSWREQFVEAVTVSADVEEEEDITPSRKYTTPWFFCDGDEDEEGRQETLPSCYDYVMHFLTVFWKVLFACVPPTEYWNGWACFLVSISSIGLLTAVIGDLASHFGCTVGLKDTVTAVVFVALGTSIPDTFASKVAAMQDQHADASVGNVTGSNAVNVFLGIGVAWSVAAIYWKINGKEFRVDPGSLAFSVTIFTIFAFISMGVLLFRRRPSIGGELGGPRLARILTTLLFLGLWFLYILFSSLEAYCHFGSF